MGKWKTLEHNGVLFPPPYRRRGLCVLWKGQRVELNAEAEEAAGFYARVKGSDRDSDRVRRNFWTDWQLLGVDPIQSLEDCDFSEFLAHFDHIKELRERFREVISSKRSEFEKAYSFAIVDGKAEGVGNFRVEPPGIFLGRGDHPLAGRIKRRLAPVDFVLNLGEQATVPSPTHEPDWTLDGGGQLAWGAIVHDHDSEWLASWVDPLTRKTKYVWLATSSQFRATSDLAKFERARALAACLPKLRAIYMAKLDSADSPDRQLAVALYLIDRLALRVGHEKSAERSADTVGVTSLRVEHLRLNPAARAVSLDFLGKDSIRYHNTFKPEQRVYDELALLANRPKASPLFPDIDAPKLNNFLAELATRLRLPGLTAKVFRTCNASSLFSRLLSSEAGGVKKAEALVFYKRANAEVARLCNHVRTKTASPVQRDKLVLALKAAASKAQTASPAKKPALRAKVAAIRARLGAVEASAAVSLATSKANYLDPRITVAYAKRHQLSPEALLGKSLAKKFFWALDASETFIF